ncbi:MAG: thermonuclease family protein [Planctomycetota bacterium]
MLKDSKSNSRIWACCLLAVTVAGCSDTMIKKSLPAPIRKEKEYQLIGKAKRMWGGDNFEFGSTNELHYIVIRGIESPKRGQEFFEISRSMIWRRIRDKQLRIQVYDRDPMMREIADVFLIGETPEQPDLNMGLELLKLGYAWFDGESFEHSESYRSAEQTARDAKIGIWKSPNPEAPWDYAAKQHEKRKRELRQLTNSNQQN